MGSLESDTTEQLHFHFSLSCVGEGNDNPLQCSCLENPRDGEAWWAAVYGVAQSRTRLTWLSSSSSSSSSWQTGPTEASRGLKQNWQQGTQQMSYEEINGWMNIKMVHMSVWIALRFLFQEREHQEMFRWYQRWSKVFPRGASGKEPTCQSRRHWRQGFDSWFGKIPWRRGWQPPPVFLPGKSHEREGATVHRITELDTTKVTKHACKGDMETRDIFPSYGLVQAPIIAVNFGLSCLS